MGSGLLWMNMDADSMNNTEVGTVGQLSGITNTIQSTLLRMWK